MTAQSAQSINQMMRTVVDEGTGQAASLGGISFAGKTGTASVGQTGQNRTDPWFIGFAPANDPKVAVAVVLENTQNEFGGQVAGADRRGGRPDPAPGGEVSHPVSPGSRRTR